MIEMKEMYENLVGFIYSLSMGDFEERIARKRQQRENSSQGLHAPGCKVLVVDDVQMNCKVFCGLLKETGIEIDTAFSGREALNKCQDKKYHMIYMDHRMPNMDGIECLHELSQYCPWMS